MLDGAECLTAVNGILSEMIRRLLVVHFDWDIQEQMHLDYISLKTRARPEGFMVNCRLKKSIGLKQKGAA